MSEQELMKDLEQRVAHSVKYAKTPLRQAPNFDLGRPLIKYEMECLRLIGACVCQTRARYNDWIRNMVLCGNISTFVRECERAKQDGFYIYTETLSIPSGKDSAIAGSAEFVRYTFPPKKTFGRGSR